MTNKELIKIAEYELHSAIRTFKALGISFELTHSINLINELKKEHDFLKLPDIHP